MAPTRFGVIPTNQIAALLRASATRRLVPVLPATDCCGPGVPALNALAARCRPPTVSPLRIFAACGRPAGATCAAHGLALDRQGLAVSSVIDSTGRRVEHAIVGDRGVGTGQLQRAGREGAERETELRCVLMRRAMCLRYRSLPARCWFSVVMPSSAPCRRSAARLQLNSWSAEADEVGVGRLGGRRLQRLVGA